jgi:uncharacterized RDD family membrane protein YckC
MARPVRIERPGAWYHVTARGNERRPIYWDNRDRRRFCEALGEAVGTFGLKLHAYVLMENHFHLLVETPEANWPVLGLGVVLSLVGLVAWIWLTIRNVVANGQTIAKKMLDIKVVRTDGSPVSLSRIFWLRNFVNGLLGVIPLYSLIDVLLIFGAERQCIHDKIADTIVVKA